MQNNNELIDKPDNLLRNTTQALKYLGRAKRCKELETLEKYKDKYYFIDDLSALKPKLNVIRERKK